MSIYPRERITRALHESLGRGIAALVAPAGFGKSEAVRDAFPNAHVIDVSERDCEVESIARQIVELANPRAVRSLLPLLQRAPSSEHRLHLARWCAERLTAVSLPIVLEDLQHLTGHPATLGFVQTLIESTVPETRWVLISRDTPALPLDVWLGRNLLALPLESDELAFTPEEVRSLAAAMHLTDLKTPEDIAEGLGGWPLAVRLSLASWERTKATPALRIRTRRVLFAFLENETWQHLHADERLILDAAAHLPELDARVLASAGFSGVAASLEQLSRRFPLLSRTSPGSYRLHDLLREFILERQHQAAEDSNALHRVAGALERFGLIAQSIATYERAGAWDNIIALLSTHGVAQIESGNRSTIAAALSRLPRKYLDHPVVAGLRGYNLSLDGAIEPAVAELRSALGADLPADLHANLAIQLAIDLLNLGRPVEATPIVEKIMQATEIEPQLRAIAASIVAVSAALDGRREAALAAVNYCSRAMPCLTTAVRCIAQSRLAAAYYYLDEKPTAEDYALQATKLAHLVGLDAVAGKCYSLLQNIAFDMHVDFSLSRRYAESFVKSSIACGNVSMQLHALASMIFLATTIGDDDLFDRAERQLAAISIDRSYVVHVAFARATHYSGLGQSAKALRALAAISDRAVRGPLETLRDALLALLLASDQKQRAIKILDRPVPTGSESNIDGRRQLAYATAYRALALWLAEREHAARRLRLSESSMAPADVVIISVIASIRDTPRKLLTSRLLEHHLQPLNEIGAYGTARFLSRICRPAATDVHLTRSEVQVLAQLRIGGTASEIAARLNRSPRTVEFHLNSIYRKIGCSGRMQAIAFANSEGLLD